MEPLFYHQIPDAIQDPSCYQSISFISPSDGTRQHLDVYFPPGNIHRALPLLLAPHPITWSSRQDYTCGLPGLNRKYHRGYFGLAAKYQIIIAMPVGHHRVVENSSLAYPPQIDDLSQIPDILGQAGFLIDRRKVYACGLSMGGLEVLVLAGYRPEILAGVAVFNPIVDLAAWQEDMHSSDLPEIREYGTAGNIAREVGGLPCERPDLYHERGAFQNPQNIALVPTLIFWSEQDLIVPRQVTHHAYKLYRVVKSKNCGSPIVEYNHTKIHGISEFDKYTRWMLHEWCDYEWALQWLLQHSQSK